MLPCAMEDIQLWSKRAACKSTEEPEIFFQDDSESNNKRNKLCTVCPVKDLCKAYAIAHGEYGFWGKTSKYQRDRLGPIFIKLVRDQFLIAGFLEYRPSLVGYLKQKEALQQVYIDPIFDLLSVMGPI